MSKILSAWAESQIYRPREVFGYYLKPFSIGHFLILTYSESPFALGGPKVSIQDLFFAISVCTRDHKGALNFLFQEDWGQESKDFGSVIAESDSSVEEGAEFFRDYIHEAMTPPEVMINTELEQSQGGAPWVHTMKLALMGKLGLTEDQVMNMWFKKAQYDWISLIESQSPKDYRLKNESDYAIDEAPKLAREEIMEKFGMAPREEQVDAAQ